MTERIQISNDGRMFRLVTDDNPNDEPANVIWEDTDEFDPGDIEIELYPGWKFIGDSGWVNDYGWNDLPIPELDEEICPDEDEITPYLSETQRIIRIKHEDDYFENSQSSETCAWWICYLFERIKKNIA